MHMLHALFIAFYHLVHGNNDFGIVILHSQQIPEFPIPCLFVRDEVCHLHIKLLALPLAYEINFSVPKLTNRNSIAGCPQVHVNNILKHFVDVGQAVVHKGVP